MVIDNIGEVISRIAIILQYDLIIDFLVVKYYLAVNDVFKLRLALWHFHSDDKGLTVGFFLLQLLHGILVETVPIVLGFGIFLTADFDSHLLQSLSCAETGICIAILK